MEMSRDELLTKRVVVVPMGGVEVAHKLRADALIIDAMPKSQKRRALSIHQIEKCTHLLPRGRGHRVKRRQHVNFDKETWTEQYTPNTVSHKFVGHCVKEM